MRQHSAQTVRFFDPRDNKIRYVVQERYDHHTTPHEMTTMSHQNPPLYFSEQLVKISLMNSLVRRTYGYAEIVHIHVIAEDGEEQRYGLSVSKRLVNYSR